MSRSLAGSFEILERHVAPVALEAARAAEDGDFEAAALRRKILALFTGRPVRHTELSADQMAALLIVERDAVLSQLGDLCKRGKLQERRAEMGRTYSLPGVDLPRTSEQTARDRKRSHNKLATLRRSMRNHPQQIAYQEKLDRVVALVAERGRLCADELRDAVGYSYSGAWCALAALEGDGRLSSAMERTALGKNLRRYFRIATPASAAAPVPSNGGTAP